MADNMPTIQQPSQRANGTMRKPRKIKPGYVPNELVPRYRPPARRQEKEESVQEQISNKESDKQKTVQIEAEETNTIDKANTHKHNTLVEPSKQKRNIYVPPHLRKKHEANETTQSRHKETFELSQADKGKEYIGSLEDAFKRVTLQSNEANEKEARKHSSLN